MQKSLYELRFKYDEDLRFNRLELKEPFEWRNELDYDCNNTIMKSKNGLFIACFFGCEKRRNEYKQLVDSLKSDSNKRIQVLIEKEPIQIQTRFSHILWDSSFEKEYLNELRLLIYSSNMAGFVGEKYQDILSLNLDSSISDYRWFHRLYAEYSVHLQYLFLYQFLNCSESLHYDENIDNILFDQRFNLIHRLPKTKQEEIKKEVINQAFKYEGNVLEFNEKKGEFEHV